METPPPLGGAGSMGGTLPSARELQVEMVLVRVCRVWRLRLGSWGSSKMALEPENCQGFSRHDPRASEA